MKKPDLKQLKHKVTNQEVIFLHKVLSQKNDVKGFKLIYAISRTLSNLRPVVDAFSMEECIPKSKGIIEYTEKVEAINKKYSGGKTRLYGDLHVYSFPWDDDPENNKKRFYDKEIDKLREEYKEEIEKREAEEKEYNDFMKEPFAEDINNYIHKVSLSDLDDCEVPEKLKFVLNYIIND